MTHPEIAYRADCVAYTIHDMRLFWLGGHTADSPWTAVTWLAERAHIADQLDPERAEPLRAWLTDGPEHARALARLGREAAYSFLVRDGLLIYILSASPHPAPTTTARQPSETVTGPHRGYALKGVVTPPASDPSAV
ncbi:hypothetical protein [Streptomyces niveus]|uniref:hypothetical protein n=1 Tax=Streptomyces niveus TaxID=193462 RepID=UPI0033E16E8B